MSMKMFKIKDGILLMKVPQDFSITSDFPGIYTPVEQEGDEYWVSSRHFKEYITYKPSDFGNHPTPAFPNKWNTYMSYSGSYKFKIEGDDIWLVDFNTNLPVCKLPEEFIEE